MRTLGTVHYLQRGWYRGDIGWVADIVRLRKAEQVCCCTISRFPSADNE